MDFAPTQKGEPMSRLIDADELLDFIQMLPIDLGRREVEDIRAHIREMTEIKAEPDAMLCKESEAYVTYLERQVARMKGEIKALTFAMRCNGVNGDEVIYEKGE